MFANLFIFKQKKNSMSNGGLLTHHNSQVDPNARLFGRMRHDWIC